MDRGSLQDRSLPLALSAETVSRVQEAPWEFGLFPLLRRMGADVRGAPIGRAALPASEPFRLGQYPSLTFAPREIANAKERMGRLHIRVFGLGMLGPNGPLPLHVTEWAREREQARQDTTTVDFLDVFHHRYFTLLYRAWASAQATAGLDRADNESFSFYVASLMGLNMEEVRDRPLPAHACLAASAHLIRESRNPDGLQATLAHYFGVPVQIEENVFQWIALDPSDCGRMGHAGPAAIMGQCATLGRVVPDRQHRFRVILGPLDLDAYLRFTPQGEDLPKLVEWVRSFVGFEFEWELELRIKPDNAPAAVMGTREKLGWSGWLGHPDPHKPIKGMCFEPERYMHSLRRSKVHRSQVS